MDKKKSIAKLKFKFEYLSEKKKLIFYVSSFIKKTVRGTN